jgi:hypothetical protein
MQKLRTQEVDVLATPVVARKPFGFSSSGVRVLDFPYVKMNLEPHSNNHLLVNEHSRHMPAPRQY